MILALWLIAGVIVVQSLKETDTFIQLGLLDNFWTRLLVIWAWPAALFATMLFPFCRDENEEVEPKL